MTRLSSHADALPPVPLLRVPRREDIPRPTRLPAGAVAPQLGGKVQAAPVRVGAVRIRNPGVSGQTGGRAGDVSHPV